MLYSCTFFLIKKYQKIKAVNQSRQSDFTTHMLGILEILPPTSGFNDKDSLAPTHVALSFD
jgi:hypothetical protein